MSIEYKLFLGAMAFILIIIITGLLAPFLVYKTKILQVVQS